MDSAERDIPQPKLARPEGKRPRVDGNTLRHSPTQTAAVTKVLDDDNLLREIIVRVVFPTTLVRAALVCKRWLGHASDPKFLSHFRKLHPPRLLGFYITEEAIWSVDLDTTHFVPMLPQPLELTAVIRSLGRYNFRAHTITHCQDGTIFTGRDEGNRSIHEMNSPLRYERRTQIVPPPPLLEDGSTPKFSGFFSKEEGSSMSYHYLSGESTEGTESTVRVYVMQGGEWRMDTLATCPRGLHLYPAAVHFGQNKIYLPSAVSDEIIILDLIALSYSKIQLPQGVEYHYL